MTPILLILAALGYLFVSELGPARSMVPNGVQTFAPLDRGHTTAAVTYAQIPPVGGKHSPVWQNCGVYTQPVANERAVHSLEHGAVWITYRPGLPADQVQMLRTLTAEQAYVLVSPYRGLPTAVVATAWGKQLRLDSASDPRLAQFVRVFAQGAQAPERGAPCTDGTSATP